MASFPPRVGALLADRYQLRQPLAPDDISQTFQAWDLEIQRLVLVRVFDPDRVTAAGWADYARVVAATAHPDLLLPELLLTNLPDPPLAVMPAHRVDRCVSLRDHAGTLPWPRALEIGERVVEILHAVFAATGVAHRHLEPTSVLVTPTGAVKLLDFGLAEIYRRAAEDIESPSDVLDYRAPEQLVGDQADDRTDQFTLAVILYEKIGGPRPFTGASSVELARNILFHPPPPLAAAPPAVNTILLRALHKRPADRYPDLQAMQRALAEARRDAPTTKPSLTPAIKPNVDNEPTLRIPVTDIGLEPSSDPQPATLAHRRPASVSLLATAPRRAHAGECFVAKFAACHPDIEPRIRARFAARPGEHNLQTEEVSAWRIGTRVEVYAHGEHMAVTPAVHWFKWDGTLATLDVEVRVDDDVAVRRDVSLAFDVGIEGIVVARVRLPVVLRPRGGWLGGLLRWLLCLLAPARTMALSAARTAFASYDAHDDLLVRPRVAALERAAGIRCQLRCLSTDERESRKPTLAREIADVDLFLLFWSPHAAASPAVAWEWHEALRLKGLPAMRAQRLDLAAPPLPPPLSVLDVEPARRAPMPLPDPSPGDSQTRRIDDTTSPAHALEQLLSTLFDAAELRRWIFHGPDGPALIELLPAESAPQAELVHQVVRLWIRRSLVDDALFDRLAHDIPRQTALVERVRDRWR